MAYIAENLIIGDTNGPTPVVHPGDVLLPNGDRDACSNGTHSIYNHFSGTNRDTNGLLNGDGKLNSDEEYEFSHWAESVRQIHERCDLSGLSRNRMDYQLSSTGHLDEPLTMGQRSIILEGDLYDLLQNVCLQHRVPLASAITFAAHQMLKGFGNGTHTVIARMSMSLGMVWPTVVSHDNGNQFSVAGAIADITNGYKHKAKGFLIHPSRLVEQAIVDLFMIFCESEIHSEQLDDFPNFPLTLKAELGTIRLRLTIVFGDQLFDNRTIDGFLDVLGTLLSEVARRPGISVGQIELLSEEQQRRLEGWNDTDGDFPSSKRLHHLIEESVSKCQNKTAVIYGDKKLSYTELNQTSNRLAHYLCNAGVRPEQLIALFIDKSELMVITIVGVWKSGAAYVPVDPAYPNERVQFVLDDTNIKVVIASQRHTRRLREEISGDRDLWIIHLEPLLDFLLQSNNDYAMQNLDHLPLTSKQLAYVTYTSGTTGIPKGIYKEHRSVVNSITDLSVRYGVTTGQEVILLFSAYVFEPFVRQMLMALVNNQTLAIIGETDKFDAHKLIPFIKKHGVTYLNGTASVLQEYDFSECPTLKRLILVGENLTESRYRALRHRFKHRIFNEYGFTESAFVTALAVFDPQTRRTNFSLGKPLRNVKCYILNHALKRVPIGATGELHIGGLGVSRGYMNRDDLTKRKFIPNPYQSEAERQRDVNALIYRTGDLARWLPNGEVEYLGRADFQIKLRGIRIEPGEIESTLTGYPGVRTSLVVSGKLKNGENETPGEHLVGYFVCDDGWIFESDLLAYLEKKLPRYMIPSRLVQLPIIPVTINGKADLRALPIVDIAKGQPAAPEDMRNEVDRHLRRIWSEVLGTPEASIRLDDNFFRLGGHSITCIQFIARIRQVLSLELSVEDVFSTRTLGAMSDLLLHKQQQARSDCMTNGHIDGTTVTHFSVPSLEADTNVENYYIANSLQQGFLYHFLKSPESSGVYVMQNLLHYNTRINPDLYKKAWIHAQRTFASLRLRFMWEKEVIQIVDREQPLDWRVLDLSSLSNFDLQDQRIKSLQKSDRAERYMLDSGSLFRVYMIKLGENRFCCLFSCHHAILDGWSLPLLYEQVHNSYLQQREGVLPVCNPDNAYGDSQAYLQKYRDENMDYWAHQIDLVDDRCDMNALLNERSRYKVPLGDYDRLEIQQEQTLIFQGNSDTEKMMQTCSTEGITLHSILQFVWHVVLHAYGGGMHTVTGTTIAGRNLPISEIERSVGLFINTLPLVVNHKDLKTKKIINALGTIQANVNTMNSRGNVELGRLRKDDLKHTLFDTLFVLETYPTLDQSRAEMHKNELAFSLESGIEKLDYPLAVIARERENASGFTFTICYAAELFEERTICGLLDMVRDTLNQVAVSLEKPVSQLEYLSSAQLNQFAAWNSTKVPFPSTTLHALFEEKVRMKSEKVAVIYENVKLTYRELNERANKMAHYLRSFVSIQADDLIALVTDKSENMIVSILAVWKSGAAYVPIDPGYPDDRVKYILSDTQAIALISDPAYTPRLERLTETKVLIVPSDISQSLGPQFSSLNPTPISSSTNLAYVIYTSGTTGRPKGVMVEHHGVVSLQVSLSEIFSLRDTDDEVILSFSNYVFDHFVEQMTDALLNGQTLLVLNDAMRGDKERLYNYISTNRVTYLSGTPSVISVYEFDRFKDHLRRVDCVGEAFSEPVFDQIRETFSGLIINGYGPTEVSITTHKRLYPFPERRTDKSIGKQVSNITSYVLDENMKRVPIGAVGELYLGGVGVARGYLNRSDLTAERFPLNPFQTEVERKENWNNRLYKTGDLVRWIPTSEGEIEYLGRNDFQVKIRGLRIELGEIEAVLSSFSGIKQSTVVAKSYETGKHNYLVGYYMSQIAIAPNDIRRFMKSKLPDYMIPTQFIAVDSFPVTVSGKLDVKALPPVDPSSDEDYVAPRSQVEFVLCDIWAELLDIPATEISIYSDFFSLGGDSLKSTKLSFMITRAFGRQVDVSSLFRHRTIESLACLVLNDTVQLSEIQPVSTESSDTPVSPAQERILFIHELANGSNAYNIDLHFQFPDSVSQDSMEQVLRLLISRHEALRTLFLRASNTRVFSQRILDNETAQSMFSVQTCCVETMKDMDLQISSMTLTIFDLERDLPFQARFHRVSATPNVYFLSLVVHHASFDAWSWDVLQRDMKAFYAAVIGKSNTRNVTQLKIHYKEYAVEHWRQLSSSRFKKLSDFWATKLDGFEPLHLSPDIPRPVYFDHIGHDLHRFLDLDITKEVQAFSRRHKASTYCVLLTAYCLTLSVYTSQKDIVIGIPVSHRNRPEFENIVGFFVNLLILRINLEAALTISDVVHEVHKELVDAQLHQDFPFQELTRLLRIDRDPSRHPIVQTVFNFETNNVNEILKRKDDNVHLELCEYKPSHGVRSAAKFDLNMTVIERAGGLKVNLNYSTSLFFEKTMDGFLSTYEHILRQLVKENNDNMALKNLSLTSTGQQYDLPSEPTPPMTDQRLTLSKLFETQANIANERIAAAQDSETISYNDLNKQANQLARYIQSIASVGPDDKIALILDKSIKMIVSILAIWKAGAAYVPLDPMFSEERIKHILHETNPKVAIVNTQYAELVTSVQYPVIEIDSSAVTSAIIEENSDNFASEAASNHLAYVTFTSGTTGKPKGVLIEQKGVINLRNCLKERYFGCNAVQESILFLSNYVFDFSVEQLALSILSGNKLIIPPRDVLFSDEFYQLCTTHGLSYLSGTPTLLSQIDLARIKSLRMVTAAGEEFHANHYEQMRKGFQGTINNAYGITETTVYNMVCKFENGDKYINSLGQLLGNMRAFVLDEELRHVPVNAVGELYLSGDCVARGYINDSNLSSQRFVTNPFRIEDDTVHSHYSRLYKTGDLVRCRPGGQLEYIGRRDMQIKLRGFRIELGDIQSVLSSVPGVDQCAIVTTYDNTSSHGRTVQSLIGYYTTNENVNLEESKIEAWLKQRLPSYMIPTRLCRVGGKLPVTINGKLDVRRLASISISAETNGTYNAPRNSWESRMCQIWVTLLGLKECGIDDDFFKIGGNSISSLQLVSEIHHELGQKATVKDIFDHRTIRSLYDHMISNKEYGNGVQPYHTEQGLVVGEAPFLPIQDWFLAKSLRHPEVWNHVFSIRTPELDISKLNIAVQLLQQHHDAFRIRILKKNGSYFQYFGESGNVDLQTQNVCEIGDEDKNELLRKWQSGFDLQRGPLAAIAYLYGYEDGSARIWFCIHHFLVDTVSWQILIRDLEKLYNGGMLGAKGSSLRQWACSIRDYKASEDERAYWDALRRQMAENQWSTQTTSSWQHLTRMLSVQTTLSLRKFCEVFGSSFHELLLTALGSVLQEVWPQDPTIITIEGHGREQSIDETLDVSRTMGWFTSMYPFLIPRIHDLSQGVTDVRESVRRVPNNGVGYGPLFGYVESPMPQVSFNYLGAFNSDMKRKEGWILSTDDEYGLATALEDANCSSSVVDITAISIGCQLQINIDSCCSVHDCKTIISSMERKLHEIAELASQDHANGYNGIQFVNPVIAPPAQDFIPYFEYRDGPRKGPTLFLLPPGEGGAESYFNNVVKHLPSSHLVVFNNFYLHSKSLKTFEELSQFYLPYIRRLQPRGPYHFLGWSFGGLLAMEITAQLVKAGEETGVLAFLDSYFNIPKATHDIGLDNDSNILDPIHHLYRPDVAALLQEGVKNLVLFKAGLMNDKYHTEQQRQLYEHFVRLEFNNLDTLVPQESIELIRFDDSHFTWVGNEEVVHRICKTLEGYLELSQTVLG
ncbi:PP-binding and AFD_class_I domain-containing protein [Emydomyces testavorans]|uniref:PP-binding and AFD_class_I domain-containing protein n=1 Tax=Emydomyces testavorans TaxID=2070801 RepID=A0AAF0DB19_9EURO|nr:PP-binding and AFD_class_I domain-containing protein [Emydomyces testavorans]